MWWHLLLSWLHAFLLQMRRHLLLSNLLRSNSVHQLRPIKGLPANIELFENQVDTVLKSEFYDAILLFDPLNKFPLYLRLITMKTTFLYLALTSTLGFCQQVSAAASNHGTLDPSQNDLKTLRNSERNTFVGSGILNADPRAETSESGITTCLLSGKPRSFRTVTSPRYPG
jgi:Leucine-rich repeat (LRR) protein